MSIDDDGPLVEVEVTIAGGACYTCLVVANSPFLEEVHRGFAGQQYGAPPVLIQMPVEGGRSAFSFMSSAISSIKTTPPVLLQTTISKPAAEAKHPAQRVLTTSEGRASVEIDDFLTPDENRELYAYALENAKHFEESKVVAEEEGLRRSKVFYQIQNSRWRTIIIDRLKIHLPYILSALGRSEFAVGNIEMQLTASNDGDFFRMHADATAELAAIVSREITYVYYFSKEPQPFSGGGLVIYPSSPDPSNYETIRSLRKIEPRNNRLVAFRSNQLHELDLVSSPTRKFEDSRFTVNGWLHPAR